MDHSLNISRFFDLKGMQLQEDSDLRSAKLVKNFRKLESRAWKIRPGFQKWGDWLDGVAPTDLTQVDGLFYYQHQRELFAVAAGAIFRESAGEFLDISTVDTTGTVAATNGSTTVTGTGTSWTLDDAEKDISIRTSDRLYKVASVDVSGQTLELTENFEGTNGVTLAYVLGFNLFPIQDGRMRAIEHKQILFFVNNLNKNLKYTKGRVSQWGVERPPTAPSAIVKVDDVGTVATVNGDATVTGTGTDWDENYAGHLITIDSVLYSIAKVTSSTTLELNRTFDEATDSGLSYSIQIHGSVRGRHYYRYTYKNANGQESNPSDPTNNIDVFDGQLEVTVTPPDPGSDVVQIRIYRTFDQDTPPEPRVLKAEDPGGAGHVDDFPGPVIITKPGLQGKGLDGADENAGDALGTKEGEIQSSVVGGILKGSSTTDLTNELKDDFVFLDIPEKTNKRVTSVRTTQVIAPSPDLTYQLVGVLKAHETLFTDNNTDFSLGPEVRFDNDVPPTFKGCLSFQGRMWGWAGNRLYFSKAGFPESYPITNFLGLPNDGDEIQTCIKYQGSIVVFRETDIWQTDGADRALTKVIDRGTIAPDSVVEVDNILYYLTDDGPRIFNGMSSRELLLNLESISNPASWKDSQVVHNRENNEIIWTLGDEVSVSPNQMLVYNYHTKDFYLFSIAARALLYHPVFNTFLHADDHVFVNNSDDDDGVAITWLWRSDNMALARFGHSRLEAILFQIKNQEQTSFTVKVRKDYEPPETAVARELTISKGAPPLWGTSKWTQFNWSTKRFIRRRLDIALTGFRHQIEITGTIKGFEFYGFELGLRDLGNRDVA